MRRVSIAVKKFAIMCHRWMGVAFSLLFTWWFVSGIFMMYWSYPAVSPRDRLERAPLLDASQVKIAPEEAVRTSGLESPSSVRLASFDGRPTYFIRAGRGSTMVYADTGESADIFGPELNLRTAAAWARQPAESARVVEMTDVDQWTLQSNIRDLQPLYKYSFPDGQDVYISENTGEVVQYTTTSSRIYAHLGAIPHWLYYTPLRTNGPLWSKIVIWSSGIATGAALLGLIVGIWMYSPNKRYRNQGEPTSIPYTGQKRLHTQLGLFFGILACTWAFSGMLSMDPFPARATGAGARGKGKGAAPGGGIQAALNGGRLRLERFAAKHPREALAQVSPFPVRELEFTSVAGEPAYLATAAPGDTRIIPVNSDPMRELDHDQLMRLVKETGGNQIAEIRWMDQYDLYYLDRLRQRALPVLFVKLNDEGETRMYIDPKTGRVAGRYTNSGRAWVNRWLYRGLHSLDFPWLYNHRPAWDIVVLGLMLACTGLCVTSMILSYRVLKRKLTFGRAKRAVRIPNEDLAIAE